MNIPGDVLRSRVQQLAEKWTDPDFWKETGSTMDSTDCGHELSALLASGALTPPDQGESVLDAIMSVIEDGQLYDRLFSETREQIKRILEREPAQPAARTGWQPIETAPKNGPWHKVRFPDGSEGEAKWVAFEGWRNRAWGLVEPIEWMPDPPLAVPAAPQGLSRREAVMASCAYCGTTYETMVAQEARPHPCVGRLLAVIEERTASPAAPPSAEPAP